MRKAIGSYGEELKPVCLYLDDLKEIVSILEGTCEKIDIQTDDVLLDSLDEIGDLKKEILNNLTISGKNPYVSLSMQPYRIWLYIHEDTPESRGLFQKVKLVLVRCQRPLARILHNTALSGLSSWIWILTGVAAIKLKSRLLGLCVGLLFILSTVWVFYGIRYYDRRSIIVVPKNRIDSPSFVKRNLDKIIVGLVCAIIGALITYLLNSWAAIR
jgi:hypothetical protein